MEEENYEILEENLISRSELYEILKSKKREDLNFREEKTLDYLKKTSKLDYENFKKASEELKKLDIPLLNEKEIIKILEIMPKTGTELRAIISKSGTILVDENVKKILDVLKKY